MNLNGADLEPERNHVFHLTFPALWKASDIIQLFSPFGHVFISWIDDTSAFVSLKEKDMADQVKLNLKSETSFRVQSYDSYAKSKTLNSEDGCGITPTLEKMPFHLANSEQEGKKRPKSPDQERVKRHKSVTDESEKTPKPKTFDEPDWD